MLREINRPLSSWCLFPVVCCILKKHNHMTLFSKSHELFLCPVKRTAISWMKNEVIWSCISFHKNHIVTFQPPCMRIAWESVRKAKRCEHSIHIGLVFTSFIFSSNPLHLNLLLPHYSGMLFPFPVFSLTLGVNNPSQIE